MADAIQKTDPLQLRAKSAMARQADEFLATSLNYYQGDIEALIGPLGMDYQRFRSQVLLSVYQNPDILKADGRSFVLAVLRAAECGLSLAPTLGLAYLVPFKEKGDPKVQLIVGYKGLVYSAIRAGMARAIRAQVIRAKDPFEYEEGAFEILRHRPDAGLTEDQRGEVIAAYAVATISQEVRTWTFMPRSELDRIELGSKAAGNPNGPWKLHRPEMQKKTAARRLCKWLQAAPDVPAHHMAALETTIDTIDGEWAPVDALPQTTAPSLAAQTVTRAEMIEPSRTYEVAGPSDPEPPPPTEEHAPQPVDPPDALAIEVASLGEAQRQAKTGKDLDALLPRLNALPKGEERDRLGREQNAQRVEINRRRT